MERRARLAAVLALALSAPGCAVAVGASVGAASGAGWGILVGGHDHKGEGAAVGVVIGAGVGALVGWGVGAIIHYAKHDSNCFGGCGAGSRRESPRRHAMTVPAGR